MKGGVSRIFNIIIQASPGGDTGGGLTGEAAARVTIAYPESERGEWRVTIACPEGEREEWRVTITCPESKEEEQRSTIQIFVSGIVRQGAAAGQERVQPRGQ